MRIILKSFYATFFLFGFILYLTAEEPKEQESPKIIYKLILEGAITPSSLDLLSEAIDKAEEANAYALIVAMDTPGGLMTSMDKMIRKILSSPIPIITYVSPKGAACGSAGVYILYASHIAAMSQATNIGSATPVQISQGGTNDEKKNQNSDTSIPDKAGVDDEINLKRKLINHAVAQIKSLAAYHNRDPLFAEKSITHAENITAADAKSRKVIEIIAEDDNDLMKQVNGRTVRMVTGTLKLETESVKIITLENDFRQDILKFLTDPNIAYLLMMIGTLGILAEVQYPGAVFPGVAGAICLILGLYSMQSLSLSYAGFGLILIGLVCFILEISILSYGMLSIAGILSLLIGSIMISDSGDSISKLSMNLAISTSLTIGAISAFLVYKSTQMMKQPNHSGDSLLIGEEGISETEVNSTSGHIRVQGELWSAKTQSGIIGKGSRLRVLKREGLVLIVEEILST